MIFGIVPVCQNNHVDFDKEKPEGNAVTCQVMEQKEQGNGLMDEKCGKPITEDSAGLCR